MRYTLHFAPDDASLIIRLALEHRGLPYRSVLVDRRRSEQSGPAFRALNPNVQIPVLETPRGALFETGAILLWLADTHGGLGPGPADPDRGDFLKWLFFAANTLHPALRMLFYPDKYVAPAAADALRTGLTGHLATQFTTLDTALGRAPAAPPGALDFYIAALMRWSALYPAARDARWFTDLPLPALRRLCARVETLPACAALQKAEGLGKYPFTAPDLPDPPTGSAT